eukprot:46619-Eustigmatos_ZCMA.PRE.1
MPVFYIRIQCNYTYTMILGSSPIPTHTRHDVNDGMSVWADSAALLWMRVFSTGEFMVPTELRRLEQYRKYKNEEVVVLNNILRHEVNAGYATDMYR